MSKIDRNAHAVHPVDHLPAVFAHSAVVGLKSSIRHQAAEVVTELRDALAKSVAAAHVVQSFELLAALQAEENAQLALLLCQRKIGCVVDAHQPLGILRDKAVPLGE